MEFTSILTSILAQLRDQLSNVNATIAALEVIDRGGKRKRGRPPKWMAEAKKATEPGGNR